MSCTFSPRFDASQSTALRSLLVAREEGRTHAQRSEKSPRPRVDKPIEAF